MDIRLHKNATTTPARRAEIQRSDKPGSHRAGCSEAVFRTCKYRPHYPAKGFTRLETARDWVLGFVRWYNHAHRHRAIRFVTPHERHVGLDHVILAPSAGRSLRRPARVTPSDGAVLSEIGHRSEPFGSTGRMPTGLRKKF